MRLKVVIFVLFVSLWGSIVAARDVRALCSFTAQWPTGMSEHTLTSGGQARRYLAYLPHSYTTNTALPIVLSFHGFASTPEQNASWSHLEQIAERYGFIAIFPAGEGTPATWNSTSNLISNNGSSDDVLFIYDLLDEVESSLCVDAEQVYAVGFSAGGGLVARLACEMPERLAAVGTVAGAFGPLPERCASQAVPLMMFHGNADMVVPYAGRWGFTDANTWAETWAAHNGCLPAAAESAAEDIDSLVFTSCNDDADVIFYTIRGGGHTWPGGQQQASMIAGKTTASMDAGESFWLFFRDYRRIEPTVEPRFANQLHQRKGLTARAVSDRRITR